MKKPLIGILTFVNQENKPQFPNQQVSVTVQNTAYLDAIAENGGVPLLLPVLPEEQLLPLYELCDGFLLPGGMDVDPQLYGEEPIPGFDCADPAQDEHWLACCRYAVAHHKPLFGICRGVQVLNVFCGGTLYQDQPSQYEGGGLLRHQQKYDRRRATHSVKVAEGTELARLLHSGRVMVNSMHHQSVRRPGEGLRVSATAPDGIIEAVENTDGSILGVQWHPEELRRTAPEMDALFAGFVRRCALSLV